MIGGKFAPLAIFNKDSDADMDTLITSFNSTITETATELLGNYRSPKKPWVTSEVLNLCNKRRDLKSKKNTTEGLNQYRDLNRKVKKTLKKAKENWIQEQCKTIESNLKTNDSKRAYQLVKDLTSPKTGRSTSIQDKTGNCLTEEDDILKRWTEYCSELYNHNTSGKPDILDVPHTNDIEEYPILREEVEEALRTLKTGK